MAIAVMKTISDPYRTDRSKGLINPALIKSLARYILFTEMLGIHFYRPFPLSKQVFLPFYHKGEDCTLLNISQKD
jgi:hypothetical protein